MNFTVNFDGKTYFISGENFDISALKEGVINCEGLEIITKGLTISANGTGIQFSGEHFRGVGAQQYRTSANDPVLADIPVGHAIDWKNTTTGVVRRYVNNAGVLQYITYSV